MSGLREEIRGRRPKRSVGSKLPIEPSSSFGSSFGSNSETENDSNTDVSFPEVQFKAHLLRMWWLVLPWAGRAGPNLTLRASPIVTLYLEDLAWQVLASAAPPSLGQTEGRQKRKRESTVK